MCNIVTPAIGEYIKIPYLMKLYQQYRIKKAGKFSYTQVKNALKHKFTRIRFLKKWILIWRTGMACSAKEWRIACFTLLYFLSER